jgi:hypothetical protein
VIKGEKVYETNRYGTKLDQAYVIKDKTPARPAQPAKK